MPLQSQDVLDRIAYAWDLHEVARAKMLEWEYLFKGEYTTPKDIFDRTAHSDQNPTFKPSRGRAILIKMLALLSLRAQMQNQVVPHKDTTAEQRLCSNLETWLEGYQYRVQREAMTPIYRHATMWALIRGKQVLQTQYIPSLIGTDYLPIRTLAVDPMCVAEVKTNGSLFYVVTQEERYVRDLKQELDRKVAKGNGWQQIKWKKNERDLADTETVALKTYWDDEFYSCYINEEEALPPSPHGLGVIPFSIGYIEDTPFADPEWQGQSILAPIADALKGQAALLSTLADANEQFFFPIGVWQSPTGNSGWIQPGIASINSIPYDAKITFYNPAPNIPILQSYKQWLDEEIQLYTLPAMSFAMSEDSAKSGFAIAQVLSQVMDKIEDKKQNIEFAMGAHFSHVLRIVEEKAEQAEGGKFEVMCLPQTGRKASKRAMLGIGKDDVAGHYTVLTTITPTLPSERMSLLQQVALMRQRDPLSKRPIVDDRTLREMDEYKSLFPHPDEIQDRVDAEFYAGTVPEIAQWEQEEFMIQWKKDHPDHPRPEQDGDLAKLSKKNLIDLVRVAQMIIKHPEILQQMGGQGQPPGMPLGAEGMMPGGMPQEGMPMMGGAPNGAPGAPMIPGMPPQMQDGNAMPFNPEEVALDQEANMFNPPMG